MRQIADHMQIMFLRRSAQRGTRGFERFVRPAKNCNGLFLERFAGQRQQGLDLTEPAAVG